MTMIAALMVMGAVHLLLRYQVQKLLVNAKLWMTLPVRFSYVIPCVGLTDLAPHGGEGIPPVIHDHNDQRDSHGFDDDRRWSDGVRYVYDAAAERAKQRIEMATWVDLSVKQ